VDPVQPQVIRLPSGQWRAAGDCLTRAFLPDPLWSMLFPDRDRRLHRLTALFSGMARASVHAGLPLVTPNISAVALWQPPRPAGLLWALRAGVPALRSGLPMQRWVLGLTPHERRRFMAVITRLDERRATLMPYPHWYLEAIGVEPTYQGEGLGSALVSDGLTRADAADTPTYLETQTEANVAFYTGFGFRVLQEVRTRELDVPVWLMVRDPVPRPELSVQQAW
jgi:ribosomal protein S18 acetylase RimI-like enzyme